MLVVTSCPELGGTMFRVVSLMIAAALLAQAPAVYHITHTYMLGGYGRWDYVVPDPPQHRVFIGRQNIGEPYRQRRSRGDRHEDEYRGTPMVHCAMQATRIDGN